MYKVGRSDLWWLWETPRMKRSGRQVSKCTLVGDGQLQGPWMVLMEENLAWSTTGVVLLIRAVYVLLLTHANLHMWELVEDNNCLLCGVTAEPHTNIVQDSIDSRALPLEAWPLTKCWERSASPWRQRGRRSSQGRERGKNTLISFVRAGEESKARSQPSQGLLHSGNDWQMQGDIGG